jgi:predicted permease
VRDPEQVVRLQQAILDNVAAVPGVVAAAFAQSVPMDGRTDHDPIVAEGIDSDRQMTNIRAYNFVSPGFFEATGIRMMAGRDLTWVDVYERRPVALVSEGLARDLWGDPRTAVGKRVRETLASPWRDVIGVVADVRDEGIDRAAPALVYFPTFLRQFLGQDVMVKRSVALAVRSPRAGSGAFLQDIRQAVWAADPDLPLADVRTLRNLYDRSMARTSFALVMLAMAGTMALLLGLVGIYAVMSSSVSQRTQEIGIRIALGAHRRQVLALVHRDSLALTVVGVAIGLAGAVAATRLLAGILFGVTPLDPGTFTAVALMLTFVAMLAAHIPARRAARLDPTMALRHE